MAFEESATDLIENFSSLGFDLKRLRSEKKLAIDYVFIERSQIIETGEYDLEGLFVRLDHAIRSVGVPLDIKSMITRLIDFLKSRQITALFTSLSHPVTSIEHTDVAVSSLMDTWVALRQIENGGDRIRSLYILKSRGMGHSTRVREFRMTPQGIVLGDEKTSDQ